MATALSVAVDLASSIEVVVAATTVDPPTTASPPHCCRNTRLVRSLRVRGGGRHGQQCSVGRQRLACRSQLVGDDQFGANGGGGRLCHDRQRHRRRVDLLRVGGRSAENRRLAFAPSLWMNFAPSAAVGLAATGTAAVSNTSFTVAAFTSAGIISEHAADGNVSACWMATGRWPP